MITMKLKIGNSILLWLGLNLFPLYIYQRIPMITIQHYAGDEWLCLHPYLYVASCFVITLILAHLSRFVKITLS